MVTPALYSTKDTQHRLGCSHTTLYEWLAQGKLIAVKMGKRTMITSESIEAFLAALPRAEIRMKPAQSSVPEQQVAA